MNIMFKDMFVLSKNGAKPVDVNVQSLGDTSIKVADLEDARREIIALSGVPSSQLGFADTIELREALAHTNVSFATEIIDQQEADTESINSLIDIIAGIKGFGKISNYTEVSMIPPVVLILQLIEMTLSSVGNIGSVFTNMGIGYDPYYLLEQYVPHINWSKFKTEATSRESEEIVKQELSGGQDQGGMY